MHLLNTQQLMQDKLSRDDFGAYAVLAGIHGQSALISSPNVDLDTYFDIASMGKVLVTSTLVLQAVGAGKLRLEDTLDACFDNVPADKKNITIRQLLTHTSGIVRIPIPKDIADRGNDAIAAHILAAPLAYAPGTNSIYSCNGYILLGFLLERIFGDSLDRIFYARLGAPLGLTRARFNIAVDEENAAVCYNRRDVGDFRVDDDNVYNMRGIAGSGASFWSIADVQKYTLAVLAKDERLYPADYFALAERDDTPDFEDGRGLGYLVVNDRYPQTGELFPTGSFGHCGHTGTSFFMHRESGLYAIVFTNATRFANIRSGFTGYDYGDVMAMRTEIHNAIRRDLLAQGLIKGG